MDYKLNNTEFVLLLLISEQPKSNGYQIRQTVIERGMAAWAGVSSSSIYVMLKKLQVRGFVTSKEDVDKRTKGAKGQVYTLSGVGKTALASAIEEALSGCREHDPRFNIALSGLDNLELHDVSACLEMRRSFLNTEIGRLAEVEASQRHLPLAATLLFDHIKSGIEAEVRWLDRIVHQVGNKEVRNGDDR